MNYELIEDITSADIAVRVKAAELGLLFKYSAEALMSESIEDISAINRAVTRAGSLEGDELDILLFEFLNEFLYFRDAENLLLLPETLAISETEKIFHLKYTLTGETFSRERHRSRIEIKAVTMHGLKVYGSNGSFTAEIVFDV